MKPTAAVFSMHFCEYSQAWLWEELKAHRRWETEVFCAERRNATAYPFEPTHEGGSLYWSTRISRKFDRLLSSGRFSLIHAHFGTGGMYALPFAQRHRLPLVVTFHGYEVPLLRSARRLYPKHWGYALLGPRVLDAMTLGLCASRELLEMLRDHGVPEERLRLHRIGIDVNRFSPGPRDPERVEMLMVGRFVEKKGFEYGLRAFARVARKHPVHLTLVGQGERESALRAIVEREGLGDRVEFAGVLPNSEVVARLRRADILLAPSVVAADGDRESGIVVVKEASASEVVPVATWHGGIPEIVDDGRTGFLVPERDVDALTDRLERLILDPALRGRMGAAGRIKMQREYDNAERVRMLEEHYDHACVIHSTR